MASQTTLADQDSSGVERHVSRPRPIYTEAQKDQALRVLAKGVSGAAVAKMMAQYCSPSTPYRWRLKAELEEANRQLAQRGLALDFAATFSGSSSPGQLRNNAEASCSSSSNSKRHVYSNDQKSLALQMLAEGSTYRATASAMGPNCSSSTPYYWRQKAELAEARVMLAAPEQAQAQGLRPNPVPLWADPAQAVMLSLTEVRQLVGGQAGQPDPHFLRRPRPVYPQVQKKRALRMLDQGATYREVAKSMGPHCSSATPFRWRQAELARIVQQGQGHKKYGSEVPARRHRSNGKPYTQDQKDEAIHLLNQGVPCREVAAMMGPYCSSGTPIRWRQAAYRTSAGRERMAQVAANNMPGLQES